MKDKKLAEKALQEALLLMNYNTSKTLTENLESIKNRLSEQVVTNPMNVDFSELKSAVFDDTTGLIDLLDFPTTVDDMKKVVELLKKYDNHFVKDEENNNKLEPAIKVIARLYTDQGVLTMGETLKGSIENTKFPFNPQGETYKRTAINLLNKAEKQKVPESGAQSPETQWQPGDVESQKTYLNKFVFKGCLEGGELKTIAHPQVQDLVVAYVIPEKNYKTNKTVDNHYWANHTAGWYGPSGKYVQDDTWECEP